MKKMMMALAAVCVTAAGLSIGATIDTDSLKAEMGYRCSFCNGTGFNGNTQYNCYHCKGTGRNSSY
ncbi:MAG: hypothetical protein IJB00_03945 [Akkermansia sp.]|nr:hypothetical protein [Akkermansia sp.]